ncbi:hypothetical protein ALI44B_05160 [Leifsonia sp. ALI-44-B]|uniref:DUF3090 domain-containing protein n=1 Tax=Leifsonia sp. ALI-44-B TaxID=1933776 RepID=UPI00097C0F47|nr:DUF3090 domain-containing protein [Leifsonia sp. ALI-44-B]ONI63994.1 hypothetical protein ALI44B_05160 [Leifsonia sp. ALI-44-B]
MPLRVHEFDWPDRAVIGTVGPPGARTFYLQVRSGTRLMCVALEKQQSALLADMIDEILDQLITVEGNPFSVPAGTPPELVDNDQLDPVEEQFRTGAINLGWDPTTAQVVIEAYPLADDDAVFDDAVRMLAEDSTPEAEMLVLRMPVGTARAFANRTREIVGAGRPACPICGYPVDPDGHICTLPED